ncbi:RloB family protein [Gulosibacter chungangensis]|uniref:RloB domain-containing protein n=1 Tax=Gulosibacter chungangensis TaxID=979746 RepID=A0A7J5B965_9MICO|nr:RloB family protein [Gulosibacter chungangensis]KAB1640983.1 RloB domain-containing protein [Gulosibacter chungangensis]
MARRKGARRPKRNLNRRGLVVTEGTVTEPTYIERLNQVLRDSGVSISVTSVPVGRDPVSVVRKAAEKRRDAEKRDKAYDWTVCLVDHDNHANLTDAVKLAEKERIDLLVSNVSFEVWLLWHVTDVRAHQSASMLENLVRKHEVVTKKHLPLNFPIHAYLEAYQIARAVDPDLAAGRVGPNPSSAMPVLIDLMSSASKRS